MSGETYTYVSLRQDRVAELQRRAKRAEALESERRLLERQQQARATEARLLQQRLADNEARYERHVRSLGEEMQSLEKATRQRFDEQRRVYQKGLSEAIERQRAYTDTQFKTLDDRMGRLDTRLSKDITRVDERVNALTEQVRQDLGTQRQEYLDLFERQHLHFDAALQQQGAILQANIDALADDMRQRLHNEQELAREWINNLQRELDFVRDRYRHEQFAPGELARLEQRLQLARSNISQGIYQSAIASGQEAFLQAHQLRERLELEELRWEHLRQAAHESATAALLFLDEHSLIRYQFDTDQALEVEVDYWTEGRWQSLRARLDPILAQSADPKVALNAEELTARRAEADAMADEALALVAMARNAAFSSIQRRDIQELMLERLERLGYQHIDSTYEAEDTRRAFHMKLRNGNGEEMVTIVEPIGEDFANRVTFDFFDHSPNDQVREERLKLIREQIETEGEMSVGEMACEPAYAKTNGPDERRNFARVRSTSSTTSDGKT
ncbi:hypothetical protein CKO25_19085 [Thiocapsa imhoffii]|uniref:Uncharacterized protein n=1 Tax=Thiocapsa imhoffii TaxID=382777 RepID=A0A9X0WLT6_9GAMM|nr:hypothetical protein [Thiocapsa imhoffii]MBK1646704.1 hypothetical protein [Thiocapsa imhoffii]